MWTASPSPEADGELDLVAVADELAHLAELGVEVVAADVGAEAHFLEFVAFLGFAGLAFLFGGEVAQLAVVQQAADRGVGVGRHLHQVKVVHTRPGEGVGHGHYAKLLTIFSDYSYPWDADLLVDPVLPGYGDTSLTGLALAGAAAMAPGRAMRPPLLGLF